MKTFCFAFLLTTLFGFQSFASASDSCVDIRAATCQGNWDPSPCGKPYRAVCIAHSPITEVTTSEITCSVLLNLEKVNGIKPEIDDLAYRIRTTLKGKSGTYELELSIGREANQVAARIHNFSNRAVTSMVGGFSSDNRFQLHTGLLLGESVSISCTK